MRAGPQAGLRGSDGVTLRRARWLGGEYRRQGGARGYRVDRGKPREWGEAVNRKQGAHSSW